MHREDPSTHTCVVLIHHFPPQRGGLDKLANPSSVKRVERAATFAGEVSQAGCRVRKLRVLPSAAHVSGRTRGAEVSLQVRR